MKTLQRMEVLKMRIRFNCDEDTWLSDVILG